jgi:ABC-type multidrug transport system fused ATPase/permease subunit
VIDADRIVVLDKGRIAAIGKHAELLETSDLYRALYSAQAQTTA